MTQKQRNTRRRYWVLAVAMTAVASAGLAWQPGTRSLALASEWMRRDESGAFYSHAPEEFPFAQLGDVPQDVGSSETIEPRSLGDTRVRQFDELDRPRFFERQTHRAAQINEERFTVVSMTGEADAQLARNEFGKAWDEFGRIADVFTDAHRNPDFGIGQLLIVIDNEPLRERDLPQRTLQIENGQTIVYLNVAAGQPPLDEQLSDLHQGAVHALLHLAELDRKFPLWVQQGFAEYTAAKIERRASEEEADAAAGSEPDGVVVTEFLPDEPQAEQFAEERYDDEDAQASVTAAATAGVNPRRPVDVEYWRLQRGVQDQLDEQVEAEAQAAAAALSQVTFLLEGDDAQHAPAFLLSLRALAQEPTDLLLASRGELAHTQLLSPAQHTIADELLAQLDEDYAQWQADPLRGQPLLLPMGEIPDPAMLEREKEMEVVLKLAQRQQLGATESVIQPRITEFGAEGQVEVASGGIKSAIDVEQLYHALIDSDEPWATIDAEGNLVLWTDHERLAQMLGVEDDRYTAEYRDDHWVLVTRFDDDTQLEAWLEPNVANPSRPLVRFAARQRAPQAQVAEFDAQQR